MEILPISTALVPAPVRARARAGFADATPRLERIDQAGAPSSAPRIGAAKAAERAPRFQFSESARDVLQMEHWHREWAEARHSLVSEAYTALHRKRAGALFDMAA